MTGVPELDADLTQHPSEIIPASYAARNVKSMLICFSLVSPFRNVITCGSTWPSTLSRNRLYWSFLSRSNSSFILLLLLSCGDVERNQFGRSHKRTISGYHTLGTNMSPCPSKNQSSGGSHDSLQSLFTPPADRRRSTYSCRAFFSTNCLSSSVAVAFGFWVRV